MKNSNPHSDRRADSPIENTETCPVTVLGCRGRVVSYLSAMGDRWDLRACEHTNANLEALFGGDLVWLTRAFPATKKSTYSLTKLRCWLYAEANRKGFFNPDRNLREPGAWWDGLDLNDVPNDSQGDGA